MSEFSRPVRVPAGWFEQYAGDMDPATRVRLAAETAAALLARVRDDADPAVVERLLALAERDGIDTVAELWADARPHSLPGALWRIHVLRTLVVQQPHEVAHLYRVGAQHLATADPVVAGAPEPAGPAEIRALADAILRGVFTGDFALALDRAAAFCIVLAAGAAHDADEHDHVEPARASALTTRAARLQSIAVDLRASAALWRRDALH